MSGWSPSTTGNYHHQLLVYFISLLLSGAVQLVGCSATLCLSEFVWKQLCQFYIHTVYVNGKSVASETKQ